MHRHHYPYAKRVAIVHTVWNVCPTTPIKSYHNQIDARGDKLNTENEVFAACEEAVEEIHAMIKHLTSANSVHFIITADHGFIYKRDKLSESDKISGLPQKNTFAGRRYAVADTAVDADGIGTVILGNVLKSSDDRIVSFLRCRQSAEEPLRFPPLPCRLTKYSAPLL